MLLLITHLAKHGGAIRPMIYRVDFADGTCCHTGYRPLALVWAKRKDSKMTEITEMATPEETRNFETVRRLHATSPEGMELDALKSGAAIAWGWLWHVTTEDDRVKQQGICWAVLPRHETPRNPDGEG